MASSNQTGNIGICGALGILFIGLKLTGYIDWSWWWVLAPIWIPITIILFLFCIAGIVEYSKYKKYN